jgi:hypothetical protein
MEHFCALSAALYVVFVVPLNNEFIHHAVCDDLNQPPKGFAHFFRHFLGPKNQAPRIEPKFSSKISTTRKRQLVVKTTQLPRPIHFEHGL